MKTKTYLSSLSMTALILIVACGPQMEFTVSIPSLELNADTVSLDVDSNLLVRSFIEEIGDGVDFYGHFYSEKRSDVLNEDGDFLSTDSTRHFGPANRGTGIQDLIDKNRFRASTTYYFRPYAIDEHGSFCTTLEDPMAFTTPNSAGGPACEAIFNINNDFCQVPCTITFENDSESIFPVTALWDYGDGSPPDNKGEHEYTVAGKYNVTLTLLDAAGNPCGNPENHEVTLEESVTFSSIASGFGAGFGPGMGAVQLPNGDYLVLTSMQNGASPTSGKDFALVRISEQGALDASFTKFYHLSSEDEPADMVQLGSGEIILVGSTVNPEINRTDKDFMYVNINDSGQLLSFSNGLPNPTVLSKTTTNEIAYRVIGTNNGKVAIVGSTSDNSDVFLAIVESDLDATTFFDRISGTGAEVGLAITQAPGAKGDVLISGRRTSGSLSEGFLERRTFEGKAKAGFSQPVFNLDNIVSFPAISIFPSSELFLGGTKASGVFAKSDFYLINANHNGGSATHLDFGEVDQDENCNDLIVLGTDTVVIAGEIDEDCFIGKYQFDGSSLSLIGRYGKSDSGREFLKKIIPTRDGGFLAVGSNDGNLLVVKTNNLNP